jgi:putative ABC transport system permease protein
MIGLALVTVVATLGAGLRHSTTAALREQVKADYVVTSEDGFQKFSAVATRPLPAVPGVGAASTVLEDRARALDADDQVDGIDPATIGHVYAFDWVPGSSPAGLGRLGNDGALLKRSYADEHHLHMGSRFMLTGPSGKRLAVAVRGIFDPPAFGKISLFSARSRSRRVPSQRRSRGPRCATPSSMSRTARSRSRPPG